MDTRFSKRTYAIIGVACLALFFLLNYAVTSSQPGRQIIPSPKSESLSILDDESSPEKIIMFFKRLNSSLNRLRPAHPEYPYLKPSKLKPLLPTISFPIQTETFAIHKHNHRVIGNPEMSTYIVGKERSKIFLQKTKDKQILEVQPKVFEYLINNATLCSSVENLEFVVSVYTAPRNFVERNAVRTTWGTASLISNHTSRTIFFLGAVVDPKLQAQIAEESKKYGDIIQTNFIDSYHNLSYKGMSQLQWLKDHCSNAKYLVKADDDLYIDVFQVVKSLQVLRFVPRFIIGSLYPHSSIIRGGIPKWTVSRHLMPGKRVYPPYYLGWSYILPGSVIKEMHEAAMRTPVFHIDDVYMTGLLAGQLPNFLFLVFNGKIPKDAIMLTHPKMASQCNAACKVPAFCTQLTRLRQVDIDFIGESRRKAVVDNLKCTVLLKAIEEKEKKAAEAKKKKVVLIKKPVSKPEKKIIVPAKNKTATAPNSDKKLEKKTVDNATLGKSNNKTPQPKVDKPSEGKKPEEKPIEIPQNKKVPQPKAVKKATDKKPEEKPK